MVFFHSVSYPCYFFLWCIHKNWKSLGQMMISTFLRLVLIRIYGKSHITKLFFPFVLSKQIYRSSWSMQPSHILIRYTKSWIFVWIKLAEDLLAVTSIMRTFAAEKRQRVWKWKKKSLGHMCFCLSVICCACCRFRMFFVGVDFSVIPPNKFHSCSDNFVLCFLFRNLPKPLFVRWLKISVAN